MIVVNVKRYSALVIGVIASLWLQLAHATGTGPDSQDPRFGMLHAGVDTDAPQAVLVDEDAARGTFHLHSPFTAPQDRGPLLVDVFPGYSPRRDFSEWGEGWASALTITRYAERGTVMYTNASILAAGVHDALTSPWGLLVQGDDAAWYPSDLRTLTRVIVSGDQKTITAYPSDGSTWIFGTDRRFPGPAAGSTYRWHLVSVTAANGQSTLLKWARAAPNDETSRLYLDEVTYGGTGANTHQYKIKFTLFDNPLSWIHHNWRAGIDDVLSKHVVQVDISSKKGDGTWEGRRRYTIRYDDGTLFPEEVARFDMVGAPVAQHQAQNLLPQPGVTRYSYDRHDFKTIAADVNRFASIAVSDGIFRLLHKLVPDTEKFKVSLRHPSALFTINDLNHDGRVDIELVGSAITQQHPPDGYYEQYLYDPILSTFMLRNPPPLPDGFDEHCRPKDAKAKGPRLLGRLRPAPVDDYSNVLAMDSVPNGPFDFNTRLWICRQDGVLLKTMDFGEEEQGFEPALVDLNGDQKPELVSATLNGFFVSQNTSSDTPITTTGVTFEGLSFAQSRKIDLPQYGVQGSSVQFVDFNGDGMLDLVQLETSDAASQDATGESARWRVYFNQGNFQFTKPFRWVIPRLGNHTPDQADPCTYVFRDMNGDSLSDVFATCPDPTQGPDGPTQHTFLFLNKGFPPSISSLSGFDLPVFDLQHASALVGPVMAGSGASVQLNLILEDGKTTRVSFHPTQLLSAVADASGDTTFVYQNEVYSTEILKSPKKVIPQEVVGWITHHVVGKPDSEVSFLYGAPSFHSESERLMGFAQSRRFDDSAIDRRVPVLTQDVTAEQLSTYWFTLTNEPRLMYRSDVTTVDGIAKVGHYDSYRYEQRTWHGVRWAKRIQHEQGWVQDGADVHDGVVEVYSACRSDLDSGSSTSCAENAAELPRCSRSVFARDSLKRVRETKRTQAPPPAAFPPRAKDLVCLVDEETVADVTAQRVDLMRLRTSYDQLGRPSKSVEGVGAEATVTATFTYDAASRPKSIVRTGVGQRSFNYTPNGLLDTVSLEDGAVSKVVARDGADRVSVAAVSRGTEVDASYRELFDYDALGRVVGHRNTLRGPQDETFRTEKRSYIEAQATQLAYGGVTYGNVGYVKVESSIDMTKKSTAVALTASDGTALSHGTEGAGGFVMSGLAFEDGANSLVSKIPRPLQEDELPMSLEALATQDYVTRSIEWGGERGSRLDKNYLNGKVASFTTDSEVDTDIAHGHLLTLVSASSISGTASRTGVDEEGRVVWKELPSGDRWTYDYDVIGRLVRVSMPDGSSGTVKYDGLGRRKRVEWSNRLALEWSYYAASNLPAHETISVAGSGEKLRETTWQRDALGRPKVVTYATPSATAETIEYFYDGATAAHPLDRSLLGYVSGIRGPGFEKQFRYRPDGLLTSANVVVDGAMMAEAYDYYFDGSVKEITRTTKVGAGPEKTSKVNLNIDAFGRVDQRLDDGSKTLEIQFNATNEPSKLSFDGDAFYLYSQPVDGQFGSWSLFAPPPGNKKMLEIATTTGLNGKQDSELISATAGDGAGQTNATLTFGYDGNGRLSTVSGGPSSVFNYSSIGLLDKRPNQSGTSVAIPGPWLASTSIDTVKYEVDRGGAVTLRGAAKVERSARGDIAAVTVAGARRQYVYDEDGVRVAARRADGTVEIQAFDRGADASLESEDLVINGVFIGRIFNDGTGTHTAWVRADSRGSLFGGLEGLADAYGQRVSPGPSDAPWGRNFAGMSFDRSAGLYRAQHRNYDPLTGRFTEPDPMVMRDPRICIDDPGGCNLFSYANGDPVNFIDPTGAQAEEGPITGVTGPAGDTGSDYEFVGMGDVINVTMTIPPPDPALEVGYLPGTDLSAPKATDSLAFWGQLHSLTAAAAGFAMLPIPAGLPEYALYRLGTTGALPFRVAQTPAVRLSRFFATSTRYAPVKSTVFGRLASSLFPALKLQQHHIAVQQYWFRGVADLQKFMPYQGAVTLGLQRLGNAGWNLMPIPAALNNLLGRSTLGTAAFAGVAYGSVPVIGYGAYQGTQYAQYLLFSNWSSDDDDQ